MLKIRLRRMGKRHRPFYRVVVSDSRSVPAAPAVDEIGHYDPMTTPPQVRIDLERVEHWSGQGAQLSPAVKKLVKGVRTGKIERAAEKAPKKTAAAPQAEEAPTEETPVEAPTEEAPAEATAEAADATAAEETAEAVAVDEEAEVKAQGAEAKDEKTVETEAAEEAAEEPAAETEANDEGEAKERAGDQ